MGSMKRSEMALKRVSAAFTSAKASATFSPTVLVESSSRLLLQIADADAVGRPGLAAKFLLDAGHDLEQGGFAGAVYAEHADLHAGQEGEGDAFEDLATARIGLGHILHHIDILIGGHGEAPNARGGWWSRMCGRSGQLRLAGIEPATKPL